MFTFYFVRTKATMSNDNMIIKPVQSLLKISTQEGGIRTGQERKDTEYE